MQNLPIIQLGVLRGQENKARSDLARLARAAKLRLLSPALHLLGRPRGRLQRRVDGPRGNRVHAYAFGNQLLGERSREGGDGAFGGGVIDEGFGSSEGDC